MANPLLESFRKTPRTRVTNSIHPLADLKQSDNPNLPWACSTYWPPNVAQFMF